MFFERVGGVEFNAEIMELDGRLRTNEGVVCVIRFNTPLGLMLLTDASSAESNILSACVSGFEICSVNC